MKARNGAAGKVAGAQSIRRAVKVLRILAVGQERGVRLTDVVEESGLNRPTAHRILRVLAEEGAVEQDPESRRYMIGQEVSLLGLARTERAAVRAVAEPYLRYLAEQPDDTVFLTIRSGFDSICVDRKTGGYPVKVLSIEVERASAARRGRRRPRAARAASDEESAAVIKANEQRLAHHQLTPAKLAERMRAARAEGYAYTDVGVVKGTRARSRFRSWAPTGARRRRSASPRSPTGSRRRVLRASSD